MFLHCPLWLPWSHLVSCANVRFSLNSMLYVLGLWCCVLLCSAVCCCVLDERYERLGSDVMLMLCLFVFISETESYRWTERAAVIWETHAEKSGRKYYWCIILVVHDLMINNHKKCCFYPKRRAMGIYSKILNHWAIPLFLHPMMI